MNDAPTTAPAPNPAAEPASEQGRRLSTDDVVETRAPGVRIFTTSLARLRRPQVVSYSIPPPPKPEPATRPARVAKMLALAHRLQAAIDSGEHEDQAAVARAFGISRARVSQLLDLTLLAPDIQEEVLFLEAAGSREPISERNLQDIVRHAAWTEQRDQWRRLRSRPSRLSGRPLTG